MRYTFTNFSEEAFTGRYAGENIVFAPNETRKFDSDKHYMLLLLGKQLATRELNKRVKSVGRDPKDMEKWGKSLDEQGSIFTITADARKALMRQAIGELVDTPIPVPKDMRAEAGATKETSKDIASLKEEIAQLTKLVTQLAKSQPAVPVASDQTTKTSEEQKPEEPEKQQGSSVTRESLTEMARERGVENPETMTKEELIKQIGTAT